jgi:predicted secreted protein
MVEIRLGPADKGKTVKTKIGDNIKIKLYENATTGYQWRISSFTDNTILFENMEYGGSDIGAHGAGGGEVTLRFKPKANGNGKVNLKLSRGKPYKASDLGYEINFNIE